MCILADFSLGLEHAFKLYKKLCIYVTRYGKREHSLSNDNAEKMAKIHGQVGIYGIGNESSMGKYNHLPTVWQKQGLRPRDKCFSERMVPFPVAGHIIMYILLRLCVCCVK